MSEPGKLAKWMADHMDDQRQDAIFALMEREYSFGVVPEEHLTYMEKEARGPVDKEKTADPMQKKISERDPASHSVVEKFTSALESLLGKRKEEANRIDDIPPPKPAPALRLVAEGIAQDGELAQGVSALRGSGLQRITVHFTGITPEELKEQPERYVIAEATAYSATEGKALTQEKDVFLTKAEELKRRGHWEYERTLAVTFSEEASDKPYFQVLDEQLGEKCEYLAIRLQATAGGQEAELQYTIVRPEDLPSAVTEKVSNILLSVMDPAESEHGTAQMVSPLLEDAVLQFKAVTEPESAKLSYRITIEALRKEGLTSCNDCLALLGMKAVVEGEDIRVPVLSSRARDAGYKSVFDYVMKKQKITDVLALRITLHAMYEEVKAEAAVTIYAQEAVDETPREADEPVLDEAEIAAEEAAVLNPQERKMWRLLRKAWPKYLAYCHEAGTNHSQLAPLFELDGAAVSFLDYDGERENLVESTRRGLRAAIILVRYPDEQWAIALPDPQNFYKPSMQLFYNGLTEKNWHKLFMSPHSMSAKHDSPIHFKHVGVVQRTENSWEVLAKGEVEIKS